MSKIKVESGRWKVEGLFLSMCVLLLAFTSCNPEAKWTTSNVDITIDVKTVSAGFVECSFSSSKDAYYLIAIEPIRADEADPMTRQKQFMTLALDSANLKYIEWRYSLLKEGEFNIAPFASHSLQYGAINHFFTNLKPNTAYWLYAFVVNPKELQPEGKLFLTTVVTTETSIMNIHFDYRVKGYWNYVYPLDNMENIYSRFPYVATTQDSVIIKETGLEPEKYFSNWLSDLLDNNLPAKLLYGVQAVENDGINSALLFEAGHTYYTAIVGFDGYWDNNVVYKFHWEGEQTEYYFIDEDYHHIH